MIILNDLNIQTRSDKPNEDWTNGQAKYVVADGSVLAAKILTCAPYFTPIEDKKGKLIDIVVGTIPINTANRKSEITSRLAEIDTEETRPLSAITLANLTGVTPNSFDITKLSELEAEKVELRAELATL